MEHFEVVVGTYEEFLLGYKFVDTKLIQSFASHDHSSSIRSLATGDHYLASGAADDRIIIYDMKTRKEHCMLTHHNSTVTCLQFADSHSHLLSGSADGVFAILKTGSWALEKVWDKSHKGMAVLDIAVHPSGKLALTLGADTILRTWNLIKGRQAYAVNLSSKSKDAKSLEKIVWAKDGIRFVLYGGRLTEVWSVECGGILKAIEHNTKVVSTVWLSKRKLLTGYEDGDMCLIRTDSGTKTIIKAHGSRVRALLKYDNWIISASSSGEIKVWNKNLEEIASINSGCRITCLVAIKPIIREEKIELKEVVEPNVETKPEQSTVVIETQDDNPTKNWQVTKNPLEPKKKKIKKMKIRE